LLHADHDPVLIQLKTLLYALVFTVTVLGGKALAATLVGHRARFSWPEIGVVKRCADHRDVPITGGRPCC
jgi:hypothetical protein